MTTMNYDLRIEAPDRRKITIAIESKNPVSERSIEFRDDMRNCPTIRVPISLPIYRMANGRTQLAQERHLHQNDLPTTYFSSGQEDVSVQSVQHKLLIDLSKDPKANIFEELERRKLQTEPLLITADGVVVNGNRRLAAMRELLASNAEDFKSYTHIDAIVLPETATDRDLEDLEVSLQMVPETKLDYDWISYRMKVRRLRDDRRYPIERIQAVMRLRSKDQVNKLISELELVEEYLDTFLHKPKQHWELGDAEQLIKELSQKLRKKKGPEREVRAAIGFNIIKESRNLNDRGYGYRTAFGNDFDEVSKRLAVALNVPMTEDAGADADADGDDPLGGPSPDTGYLGALHAKLIDPSKSSTTAPIIAGIVSTIRKDQEDKDAQDAALKLVRLANRELADVDLASAQTSDLHEIVAQLESILSVAMRLKEQASTIESRL